MQNSLLRDGTARASQRCRCIALCLAALAACASVTRHAGWSPTQTRGVERVHEALRVGDLALAREHFAALAPSASQRNLAAELEQRIAAREIEPFEPAFAELSSALRAGDDELARSILAYAAARGPRGAALEIAERFAGRLEARARVGRLVLALEEAGGAQGETVKVELVARNLGEERIELRAPGAALDHRIVGLTPDGVEQRRGQRVFVDALDRLSLRGGEVRRISLGSFSAPIAGYIALRGEWRLSAASGLVRIDGLELLADELRVAPLESSRRDPRLPSAPIEPQSLVDYVRRGAPSMPALLERAVRIEPTRRDEALTLLAPALLERPQLELQRAAPILRWLARESFGDGFGEDAQRWRAWLSERAARGESSRPPDLELPDRLEAERSGALRASVER